MALNKLSDVANALSQRFAPKLARQFNRMAVLGAAVPSEAGFGKNVAWDVETSGALAASYAEGDDVTSGEYAVDKLIPASLSWGHYRSAFQVSETEFDAAASSAGSADAIIKLFEERIMGNGMKLASAINADLWTGTGADGSGNPNVVGVLGGALDATGTYANVDRGVYTEFAGNVLANGGVARPLSVDLLEQADQNIFTASGLRPNLLVCSPGVFRKYKGLFESIRRIQGEGPIQHYDTSTSLLFWNGVTILRDKDATESAGKGTLVMLNTNHMKKVYLPISPMSGEDAFKIKEVSGVGGNGEGEDNNLAVPFKIVPLAKTGDSLKFMIKCVMQLKVDRPNSMAVLKDIAV